MSLRFFDWRRLLVYTHRWLGIAGCLLFIAWFISGIVMMYARMPGLADEERLGRAQPLDLSAATLSPVEAAARAGVESGNSLQVSMLLGRPVYRLGSGRNQSIVFADTGERFEGLNETQAKTAAAVFAPGGTPRYDGTLVEPDQWTLQARQSLPIYRYALDDDEETYLYVSAVSGGVILRTTKRERFWGYLGPVAHWLYFTPLRKNGAMWSDVVIWSSLVGCVMCVAGLLWGVVRYSPFARFRLRDARSRTPYAGTMMWHHYAGLVFGVVTLTWTYSGLLSMEPFGWFAPPADARAGRSVSTARTAVDDVTLASLTAALTTFQREFLPRELDLVSIEDAPYWSASWPPDVERLAPWMHVGLVPRAPLPLLERRYVSVQRPDMPAISNFPRDLIERIARKAMPAETPVRDAMWLDEYDGHYYDARGMRPLPVYRVRYADRYSTWVYADPSRGAVVQRSIAVTRLQRWLYHGLHSLDFPFLYFHRPLWDIVVIVLSVGGTILSVTTLLPAARRLRRRWRDLMRLMARRRVA